MNSECNTSQGFFMSGANINRIAIQGNGEFRTEYDSKEIERQRED